MRIGSQVETKREVDSTSPYLIPRSKAAEKPAAFEVTPKVRLTISNFADETGYQPGAKFTLEKPRGKSDAWRLVPIQ